MEVADRAGNDIAQLLRRFENIVGFAPVRGFLFKGAGVVLGIGFFCWDVYGGGLIFLNWILLWIEMSLYLGWEVLFFWGF